MSGYDACIPARTREVVVGGGAGGREEEKEEEDGGRGGGGGRRGVIVSEVETVEHSRAEEEKEEKEKESRTYDDGDDDNDNDDGGRRKVSMRKDVGVFEKKRARENLFYRCKKSVTSVIRHGIKKLQSKQQREIIMIIVASERVSRRRKFVHKVLALLRRLPLLTYLLGLVALLSIDVFSRSRIVDEHGFSQGVHGSFFGSPSLISDLYTSLVSALRKEDNASYGTSYDTSYYRTNVWSWYQSSFINTSSIQRTLLTSPLVQEKKEEEKEKDKKRGKEKEEDDADDDGGGDDERSHKTITTTTTKEEEEEGEAEGETVAEATIAKEEEEREDEEGQEEEEKKQATVEEKAEGEEREAAAVIRVEGVTEGGESIHAQQEQQQQQKQQQQQVQQQQQQKRQQKRQQEEEEEEKKKNIKKWLKYMMSQTFEESRFLPPLHQSVLYPFIYFPVPLLAEDACDALPAVASATITPSTTTVSFAPPLPPRPSSSSRGRDGGLVGVERAHEAAAEGGEREGERAGEGEREGREEGERGEGERGEGGRGGGFVAEEESLFVKEEKGDEENCLHASVPLLQPPRLLCALQKQLNEMEGGLEMKYQPFFISDEEPGYPLSFTTTSTSSTLTTTTTTTDKTSTSTTGAPTATATAEKEEDHVRGAQEGIASLSSHITRKKRKGKTSSSSQQQKQQQKQQEEPQWEREDVVASEKEETEEKSGDMFFPTSFPKKMVEKRKQYLRGYWAYNMILKVSSQRGDSREAMALIISAPYSSVHSLHINNTIHSNRRTSTSHRTQKEKRGKVFQKEKKRKTRDMVDVDSNTNNPPTSSSSSSNSNSNSNSTASRRGRGSSGSSTSSSESDERRKREIKDTISLASLAGAISIYLNNNAAWLSRDVYIILTEKQLPYSAGAAAWTEAYLRRRASFLRSGVLRTAFILEMDTPPPPPPSSSSVMLMSKERKHSHSQTEGEKEEEVEEEEKEGKTAYHNTEDDEWDVTENKTKAKKKMEKKSKEDGRSAMIMTTPTPTTITSINTTNPHNRKRDDAQKQKKMMQQQKQQQHEEEEEEEQHKMNIKKRRKKIKKEGETRTTTTTHQNDVNKELIQSERTYEEEDDNGDDDVDMLLVLDDIYKEDMWISALAADIEGADGRLPNQDLVNVGAIEAGTLHIPVRMRQVWESVYRMVFNLGAHRPHAALLREAVPAATFLLQREQSSSQTNSFSSSYSPSPPTLKTTEDLARFIERYVRSQSNMLEALHHSFNFYFYTTPYHHVCSGFYFYPIALMLAVVAFPWITSRVVRDVRAFYFAAAALLLAMISSLPPYLLCTSHAFNEMLFGDAYALLPRCTSYDPNDFPIYGQKASIWLQVLVGCYAIVAAILYMVACRIQRQAKDAHEDVVSRLQLLHHQQQQQQRQQQQQHHDPYDYYYDDYHQEQQKQQQQEPEESDLQMIIEKYRWDPGRLWDIRRIPLSQEQIEHKQELESIERMLQADALAAQEEEKRKKKKKQKRGGQKEECNEKEEDKEDGEEREKKNKRIHQREGKQERQIVPSQEEEDKDEEEGRKKELDEAVTTHKDEEKEIAEGEEEEEKETEERIETTWIPPRAPPPLWITLRAFCVRLFSAWLIVVVMLLNWSQGALLSLLLLLPVWLLVPLTYDIYPQQSVLLLPLATSTKKKNHGENDGDLDKHNIPASTSSSSSSSSSRCAGRPPPSRSLATTTTTSATTTTPSSSTGAATRTAGTTAVAAETQKPSGSRSSRTGRSSSSRGSGSSSSSISSSSRSNNEEEQHEQQQQHVGRDTYTQRTTTTIATAPTAFDDKDTFTTTNPTCRTVINEKRNNICGQNTNEGAPEKKMVFLESEHDADISSDMDSHQSRENLFIKMWGIFKRVVTRKQRSVQKRRGKYDPPVDMAVVQQRLLRERKIITTLYLFRKLSFLCIFLLLHLFLFDTSLTVTSRRLFLTYLDKLVQFLEEMFFTPLSASFAAIGIPLHTLFSSISWIRSSTMLLQPPHTLYPSVLPPSRPLPPLFSPTFAATSSMGGGGGGLDNIVRGAPDGWSFFSPSLSAATLSQQQQQQQPQEQRQLRFRGDHFFFLPTTNTVPSDFELLLYATARDAFCVRTNSLALFFFGLVPIYFFSLMVFLILPV